MTLISHYLRLARLTLVGLVSHSSTISNDPATPFFSKGGWGEANSTREGATNLSSLKHGKGEF